jgi:hypothetical protein
MAKPAAPVPVPASGSAAVNAAIPAAQTPIVDKNGLMLVQFYRFLVALFNRTGGAAGVSTQSLVDTVVTLTTDINSLIDESALGLFTADRGQEQLLEEAGVFGALLMLQRLEFSGVDKITPAMLLASAMVDSSRIMPIAPIGVPFPVISSETIGAGAFINIWDNAGIANIRNANATDNLKPADGFILVGVTTGVEGEVFFSGQVNNQLSGLTPGISYFLDITNGNITSTFPNASGNYVQNLGKALSSTTMVFNFQTGFIHG